MINTDLINNYSQFFKNGYIENEVLFGSNWELFWNFAAERRFQLQFYPFEKDSNVLLIGDSFSALAGILLDKCAAVDSLLDFSDAREIKNKCKIAKLRFPGLNILDKIPDAYGTQKYKYIILNISELDYVEGYVSLVLNIMPENCKLLICAEGNFNDEIKKVLLANGISKHQQFDPLCNGMLVIECTKVGDLVSENQLDWTEYKSLGDGYYRSPLLDSRWIQKHVFPIFYDKCKDQDFDLIEDVKKVQLDLLSKLLDVCAKNNLKIYPIYGTLLGLVRDGGYIKGDDDIDVALMRDDYDKLLSLQNQFTDKYFLQTGANDDCFFGGYARLRNTQTTAIIPPNWWKNCCEGIGIDIFPLDYASRDKKKEAARLRKIRFYQRLLYADSYGFFANFMDMSLLKWKFYKYLGKLFGRKKMLEGLESVLKAGDKHNSQLSVYTRYRNGQLSEQAYFSKALFGNTVELNYEGIVLSAPVGFDQLLKLFYGDEYNSQYGFNEAKIRHGFYNVSVPYQVYKKRFGGLKHPSAIKEPVILFGDGSVFKACLSYYKTRVNIAHLVLLPGYQKEDLNLPVKTWDEFEKLGLEKSSYRAIICSNDVRYAEKVLTDKGFCDYYIFYHERKWMLYANQSQIIKEIQNL